MRLKPILVCLLLLSGLGLAGPADLASQESAPKSVGRGDASAKAAAPGKKRISAANRFNRLLRSTSDINPPPSRDGIHDPQNVGTEALQPPAEAFAGLPKSKFGNHVDWIRALREGYIEPRANHIDDGAEKMVMDLDIVREVKGSMPDVVYPHKAHTEWLECSNCHSKIFVPKKGANPMSMAAIILGQYCGVCHGKVAFPVSECRRCHSKPKSPKRLASLASGPTPGSTPVEDSSEESRGKVAAIPKVKPETASRKVWSREDLMARGQEVYDENCGGCHGEKGEGIPPDFPPLLRSAIVTGPADKHIATVLKGVPETAMIAWKEDLTDADIAAVVTFERNSWGNDAGDAIQPAEVAAAR